MLSARGFLHGARHVVPQPGSELGFAKLELRAAKTRGWRHRGDAVDFANAGRGEGGVDVPGRGDYRNAITHEIMKRIKKKTPKSNRLYFDPTHSIGPVMRHKIIDEIMLSMKMKIGDHFLYDGLLMEAGSSSPVDLREHITIEELKKLVIDLSVFRKLRAPER